jgi:hypothetical protein
VPGQVLFFSPESPMRTAVWTSTRERFGGLFFSLMAAMDGQKVGFRTYLARFSNRFSKTDELGAPSERVGMCSRPLSGTTHFGFP